MKASKLKIGLLTLTLALGVSSMGYAKVSDDEDQATVLGFNWVIALREGSISAQEVNEYAQKADKLKGRGESAILAKVSIWSHATVYPMQVLQQECPNTKWGNKLISQISPNVIPNGFKEDFYSVQSIMGFAYYTGSCGLKKNQTKGISLLKTSCKAGIGISCNFLRGNNIK